MTKTLARTAPFGDLLKALRTRRGLSQLQLASVAGYSQRHVSFLESGRSHPTRGTVLVLADAVCDTLEARNSLLQAARYADEYPASALGGEALRLAVAACRQTLDAMTPFPAVLIDRAWTVLGANRAAIAFYSQFQPNGRWAGHAANGMRTHFEPEGLRPYIDNWPEVAQHYMVRVRLRLLEDPTNTMARGIVADFGDEVAQATGGQTRVLPSGGEAAFTIALRKGRNVYRYQTLFAAFSDPQDITAAQLRIECFVPADEATRAHFLALEAATVSERRA